MLIEEILPFTEIKTFYGDELKEYTGTLKHLPDAVAREPYYIGGAIANSWMRVCHKHGFAPKSLSDFLERITLPGFETTVPVPNKAAIPEIERLTGETFIKAMAFSRCMFHDELAAELLVMETYPSVLHLGSVTFLDLNQPIPPSHRWNEKQTHKGLGLLGTLVERMKTYAKEHGLEWITLSASSDDLMPLFAKHGFAIAKYDRAKESRHMEMKVQ